MKWLVTGGAGFIGTNVATRLLQRGHTLALADSFWRTGTRENQAHLLQHYGQAVDYLDIRFRDQVFSYFESNNAIEVVLHLAGQVSLVASIEDPVYDFDTNAVGTFNLLEATRRIAPNAKFIYASTNKVYGDLENLAYTEGERRYFLTDYPDGIPESLPVRLHGGYSCSKGAADQYVTDYFNMYGLKTVSLRQSSVYGGYQRATEDQGWVAYFVRMGVEGLPFNIHGNGKQVRDLLHVSDLVDLYESLSMLPEQSPAFGQACNVGGGVHQSLSLLELFDKLRAEYQLPITYTSREPRPADQKVFISDNTKVRDYTGWTPSKTVDQGLEELVEWTKRIVGRGEKP